MAVPRFIKSNHLIQTKWSESNKVKEIFDNICGDIALNMIIKKYIISKDEFVQ